ncbi:MAG: hypothetical protein JKY70_11985 [Mucilaginibacter sp.]|nr:hypothetical protein [Mucilaginibacter sp.]
MNRYRYPVSRFVRRVPGTGRETDPHLRGNGADQQTESPEHGTYGGLLFHPNWKAKRAEVLLRDGGRCVICAAEEDLQIHHRQYHFISQQQKFKMPWDYEGKLLITLCKSCHNRGHNKFKVPVKYI